MKHLIDIKDLSVEEIDELIKVAKDIIQESGNGLNPIVKCIGSNNYTLQVGIFKNKQSAESLLYTVQQRFCALFILKNTNL